VPEDALPGMPMLDPGVVGAGVVGAGVVGVVAEPELVPLELDPEVAPLELDPEVAPLVELSVLGLLPVVAAGLLGLALEPEVPPVEVCAMEAAEAPSSAAAIAAPRIFIFMCVLLES
jgi:hypothetical protein